MHINEAAKILNIAQTADLATIKRSYRNLSLQYHPDRNINETEAKQQEASKKFLEISEAYQILSNYIANPFTEFITPLGRGTFTDPNQLFQNMQMGGINNFFTTTVNLNQQNTSFQTYTTIVNNKKTTHTRQVVNGKVIKDTIDEENMST